jgi:PIN domain nuclease of toxin-antitoxin system
VTPKRLSRDARRIIGNATEIGVSSISFWEIALLERAGKIELDRGARSWTRATVAVDPRMTVLLVTPEIALTAGGLAGIREPGDSIIYATAVEHDAPLVSRDERLHRLDPERVVW